MSIRVLRMLVGLVAMSALASAWGIAAEGLFTGREGPLEFRDFLLLESPRAERSHLDLSDASPGVRRYSGGALPSGTSSSPRMYTFKASFRVDPSLEGRDLSLYMGLAEYPYRLYLNGVEIFAKGRYEGGHYNSSLRAVDSVYLSPDLLRYGDAENALVLEAYPRYETWGLDRIYIDRKAAVDAAVFLRNFIGINLIQGAFVLVLIIGLYFFALFFVSGRSYPKHLVFSLMCASFCLSYLSVTIHYDANDEVLLEALSKGGLVLMSSLMLVFCCELTSVLNARRVFPLASLALGAAAAGIVMTRGSKETILAWFGYAMNYLIVPQILVDMGLLVFALVKKGNRYVLPLLAAFAVIIVTGGNDVVHLNESVLPYAWLTAYGYVAVVVAIFAILVKEQSDLAAANSRLSAEVAERRLAEEKGRAVAGAKDALLKDLRAIEENLRRSEQRYRDILEKAVDGIFLLDAEGNFLMVNSEICEMLGYAREELVRMSILDTYPEEARDEGRTRLERIDAGEKLRFERMMKRKDGSVFLVEMSAGRLADGTQQAIARDITERKRAEELLRSSLAEKEVLLREIHHRVKNNLQVISSIISLQKASFRDEADRDMGVDMQARIQSMAQLHELLYGSGDFSSIDPAEYLEAIVGVVTQSYGEAEMRVAAQSDSLPIDEAIPFGLIATELLTNALKYAYPYGRAGDIYVSYGRSETARRLEVRDAGTGLPPGFDPSNSASMGFTLVYSLAEQLGGRLSISEADPGKPSPGLSVALSFPVRP
jgi:PAS domain S-box-containing protein